MEYIYLLIACTFFSLQFIFQKLFERRTIGGLGVCLWNMIVCCTIGSIFLVIKSGFPTQFTWGAFILAFLTSACGIICTVSTITAMSYGKVSVVTTFCLAGGMIVPFVFGIAALNETAGLFKWIGMAILCISLIPALIQKGDSAVEKKGNLKFIICNILIFMTNGIISVFSKIHQISDFAVDETSYLCTSAAIRLVTSILILLLLAFVKKNKGDAAPIKNTLWEIGREKMNMKLYIYLIVVSGTYAVCNTLGETFNLYCMKTMDASIQFPVLSAVVIIMGAIFGRLFFKEKITKSSALSLILSVIGIGLFMIQ
ncbi:MAG: EamA family transporter [Lachnospiraceae bacterium]|nr:EamA family transporter [Lachnospiraceae bacterium]